VETRAEVQTRPGFELLLVRTPVAFCVRMPLIPPQSLLSSFPFLRMLPSIAGCFSCALPSNSWFCSFSQFRLITASEKISSRDSCRWRDPGRIITKGHIAKLVRWDFLQTFSLSFGILPHLVTFLLCLPSRAQPLLPDSLPRFISLFSISLTPDAAN